jgi:hypothetical protein
VGVPALRKLDIGMREELVQVHGLPSHRSHNGASSLAGPRSPMLKNAAIGMVVQTHDGCWALAWLRCGSMPVFWFSRPSVSMSARRSGPWHPRPGSGTSSRVKLYKERASFAKEDAGSEPAAFQPPKAPFRMTEC